MHYLYRITNILNSKIYIGQSNKENDRWRQHKYFSRLNPVQYIHRAMAKYGIENFTYEVIAMCLTQADTDETEIKLIIQYNSRNLLYGYNISHGADPAWNRGLPKEQQPMYGKQHSEKTRKKISESNKGRIVIISEDQKKKMSKAHMGRKFSKETLEKISLSNKGLHRSVETKNKMSKSKIGSKNRAGKFKYTEEQKNEIIELHNSGISNNKISVIYNYSSGTINNIIKRYKQLNVE